MADPDAPDREPSPVATVAFPGARRPDRRRTVESTGLSIAVSEWGDPAAPPMVMAHGGFDFAGTLDVFAPLLADGGWRVVSWDQRGHGDSDRAALYSWEADLRDAAAVLDSVSPDPMPFLGHSKGGSLMMHLANALPHRVSALVNLDGLPSHQVMSDVSEQQRTRLLHKELTSWLATGGRWRTSSAGPARSTSWPPAGGR